MCSQAEKAADADTVVQDADVAATEDAAAAAGPSAVALLSASRLGQGPLTLEELTGLAVTMADFSSAISKVQPSVRREGFATTPDVTWDDVGSLGEVRAG